MLPRALEQALKAKQRRETQASDLSLRNIQDRRGLMAPRVWGEMMLTIPRAEHDALVRANPDLAAPDGAIRLKAWRKFANSPEARPYHVSANPHRRF